MILTLSHGPMTAAVDTHGGELVSLRDGDGTEYIWHGDPAYWAGRNPILFPIVGALRNGTARFRGRDIRLPRHGFARNMEFAVLQQEPDYVWLELRETADTLAQYPFPFRLTVEHALDRSGFYTSFTVFNPGDEPLPFCIGGHTAFRCPLREGESFEDYQLVFDMKEKAAPIPVGPDGLLRHDPGAYIFQDRDTIPLRHELFDRADTLIFDGLRSGRVRLVHKDTGRGVYVSFADFPMVAFWTPPGKNAPFVCVEPWRGCGAYEDDAGDFEKKPNVVIAEPGHYKHWTCRVDIL